MTTDATPEVLRHELDRLEDSIAQREALMNAQLRTHMDALALMHQDADRLREALGLIRPRLHLVSPG